MERAQVIALAVLVAALALFGVGYVVDGGTAPAPDAVVAGAGRDGARPRVGIANYEPESRRRGRSAAGSRPPGDDGEHGDGRDAEDGPTGRVAVVSGGRRAASGLGRSGSEAADDIIAGGISADLLAARTGTLPRAGGGIEAPPRHGGDAGDGGDEPVPEEPQRDAGGVLLSIPLKGSIDPEQGGGPTQADGVIVDGDAVLFTDEAQYTLPAGGHVDGSMGTIAFEIAPNWAGGDATNNSLLQIREEHTWENNLQIVKNYDALRFIIIDSQGVETNVNVYISDWQAAEPHRVAATWGEALMTLYVDGQQVGQTTLPNELRFRDSTPIHVGSDFPGSQYRGADGRISDLRIYGRPLGAGEIH
jgi:hypothetical protein